MSKSEYLNDGSIEERSLCLALIRQVMSGNNPDLNLLITSYTDVYLDKAHGGFFYREFPNDRWDYTRKIANNIPKWPCLRLKPNILEEAIRNCLIQHDLRYFNNVVSFNINSWFIFNITEKSNFWYDVTETLKDGPKIFKETNTDQTTKTQENEIKFQRKRGSILRGTVPEGNRQSSGKCKTATCSGHLSYQICSGR